MHEFALVDNIFQILNVKINEYKIKKINQIKLVIGEMTGAEEVTLSACFEVYAKGTVAEGAQLVFERIPLRGKCLECGHEFRVKNYKFICPECNVKTVEVVSGREFYIDSLLAE